VIRKTVTHIMCVSRGMASPYCSNRWYLAEHVVKHRTPRPLTCFACLEFVRKRKWLVVPDMGYVHCATFKMGATPIHGM